MDKGIITLLNDYYDNPVWFAEDMLNFHADKWQSDTLMALANNPKVSVRSGQGVGKTGLESIAVTWYLCTRPFPKVVATAPTRQQLYDVLWAEISKWLSNSMVNNLLQWTKTKVYMKGFEDRWWATARTAVKPENMQGFHEDYISADPESLNDSSDNSNSSSNSTGDGDSTNIPDDENNSENDDTSNENSGKIDTEESIRDNIKSGKSIH